MKNYNGKEVKLVCESTGVEKSIGDTVLSFRGELATIKFDESTAQVEFKWFRK